MFLKDLLFPKFCLGCGFLGAYICTKCKRKLSYIEKDCCLYCGRASLSGFTHPGCKREKGIDGAISLFRYNNFLKTVIKNIKYRRATDVWKELCLVIEPDKISKINIFKEIIARPLYLQSIPLHKDKLRSRGFNQANIITIFFNQFLNFKQSSALIRKKDTLAQAQMKNNQDRFKNMIGAFEALSKEIPAKNFILVDDVVTTGSTLKDACRVLKSAGAGKVFVLTLAKG